MDDSIGGRVVILTGRSFERITRRRRFDYRGGGTVPAMVTTSRGDRAEALARDVRQLFRLVGIPEDGHAGGYHISTYGGHVKVSWCAETGFDGETGSLGVDHPDHPMVRLERAATAAMERAMANVLYAAGFTVALVPGVPNRADVEKERDPEVVVLSGPGFKAWQSG
jgi:hypothetical protein